MARRFHWTLLVLGAILALATVKAAVAQPYYSYGYYYGAGGYPPYDGHQWYGYGPGAMYPSGSGFLYPTNYYSHYYGSGYGHYSYYPHYASYYPHSYYRGWGTPWYSSYWPYSYRVYYRWWP